MANEFKVKNGLIVVGDLTTSGTITINGALAATQSWVTSQSYLTSASLSGYATQSYVTSAISALIDAAPAALDTLNELAAALGDDASFSTTVTNSIAGKMALYNGVGAPDFNTNITNGIYRNQGGANAPVSGGHFTMFSAFQPDGNYGWQLAASASDSLYFRFKDANFNSWLQLATRSWVQAQGFLTSASDVWVNTTGDTMTGDLTFANNADNVRINKNNNWLNLYDPWNNIHLRNGNSGYGIYADSTAHYWRPHDGSAYWMTLSSTGLGIGTSSPGAKIHVVPTGTQIGVIADGTSVTADTANKVLDVLYNGGSSAFSVRSNGIVYIGYDNLYVEGAGITRRYFDSRIQFGTADLSSSTTGANVEVYGGLKVFRNISNSSTPEIFRITNGGNVGIGTTSPSYSLHVVGDVALQGNDILLGTSGQTTYARFVNAGANYLYAESGGTLSFGSNGATNHIFIGTSGNVGIGTSSPSYKLDVAGSIRTQDGYIIGANGNADITIDGNIGSQLRYGTQKILLNSADAYIYTNNIARVFVNNAGDVGIGTTGPTYKLDVNGSIRTSGVGGLYIDASANFGDNSGAIFDILNLGSTRALRILATSNNGWGNILLNVYGGNVGIGTVSPSYKLDVSGTARFTQSISLNQSAVIKKRFDSGTNNPVKTASGVLASRSDNGGGSTYYVIETNVPQDDYQMGGFTIELFGNYSSTNHKTKIDLGGYWNPEGNGGFIGFEAHGSNPQYKPTIEVARNTSTGNTAFIIYGLSWNYPVIVARDLWLGYSGTDGGAYGEGWSIVGTETISGYSNRDTVVWRNAYSDSNPAGYITGYTETDTLQSVTSRGATTNTLVSLNAGLRMGNAYLTPSGDQNHFHFDGTAIIPNSSTTANNASIGTNTYRWSSVYGGYGYFSENVGIGTTSPTLKFQIDTTGFSLRLRETSDGSSLVMSGNQIQTRTSADAGSPLYLNFTNGGNIYTGNGNVGIGTTNPTGQLTVAKQYSSYTPGEYLLKLRGGNGAIYDLVDAYYEGDAGILRVGYAGLNNSRAVINGGTGGNGASLNLLYGSTLKTYITADGASYFNGGNVGIGTSTPMRALNIVSNNAQIRISDSTAPSTNYWEFSSVYFNTNQDLFISNQSVTALTINSSGNVGIGTTSPSATLSIQTGVSDSSGNAFLFTGYNSKEYVSISKLGFIRTRASDLNGANMHFLSNDGANRVEVSASNTAFNWYSHALATTFLTFQHTTGNIGIGTTSPGAKLHVIGNTYIESGNLYVNTIAGYSTNLVSIAASTNVLVPSGDITIGSGASTSTTQPFGDFSQLKFDNLHSDTNRGPNKIVMHDNGGSWIGGFGIHSDTVSYYTGGHHRWYKTDSQTSSSQVMQLDPSGNLTLAGTLSASGYNKSNWDTAYSWGNHASAGYLTSFTETDTLASVTGRGNSTTNRINVRGIGNQSGGNIMMGDVGEGTNKWSYLTGTHYNASSQPQGFALIGGLTTDSFNAVVIGGNIYETNPATEIQFWTHSATTHNLGGTQRGVITSAGNWGVGTTSPQSRLHVETSSSNVFRMVRGSTSFGFEIGGGTIGLYDYDDSVYRWYVDSIGNIGIGTTSPSYKLDISGNSRTTGIHYVDTYLVTPYIYGGGPITMGNNVFINSTEDGKLTLRVPSGDSSEWNYINFTGSNGVRDAYLGTDGGGTPTWYRDDNGVNITLGSSVLINGNTAWHSGNDGSGSGLDADTVDGIDSGSFLRSDVSDSFSGTLTMATQRAFIPSNYGHGVYGLYSAERYQHVWSMGAGYDLPADGVSNGNGGSLYGLAWSYNPDYSYVGSNAQSKPGLNHQLLLMMNGITYTALGNGIWTSGTITTVSHGTSANWNTAYGWGNHASQSYATTSYVTTQINNLINGAPGALDTLSELASALGNDASFATTVTNSIAGKISKSGDTMTGNLTTTGLTVGNGVATGRQPYGPLANANIILTSSAADSSGVCGIEFLSGNNYPSDGASIYFQNNANGGSERAKLTIRVENDQEDFIELRAGKVVINANTYSGGGQNPAVVFQHNDSQIASITSGGQIDASGGNSSQWNTAYGWGNHASAGYALNSSLANYLPLAGGTMSGGLNFGNNDIYGVNNLRINDPGVGEGITWESGNGWGIFECPDVFDNTAGNLQFALNATTRLMTLNTAGALWIAGALTEASSLKLKENIETSEGNLEKVVNLRPVTYNKIGSQTTELGLIAEEVAEVYPEFVQYDENGEPIGVHYSRLTAALIGAVKELNEQLQELKRNK